MVLRGSGEAGPGRARPVVALAVALPLLLALVVAGIGITLRLSGTGEPAPAETGPFDAGPATDPSASSAACARLLGALPASLGSDAGALPTREVAPPSPGVRAWAAAPDPVVLHCGVPRPAELGPTSPLIVINGVSWLALPEAPGARSRTYTVVDRPVFVALSAPSDAGSGPLQSVSNAITATLQQAPVRVR